MPIEITGAHPPEHRIRPSDVLMIRRQLKDKETSKPFDWTFFAVVIRVVRSSAFQCMILDDKPDREPMMVRPGIFDEKFRVWYLPEKEWPDGVHVFLTKLILEGRLDEIT